MKSRRPLFRTLAIFLMVLVTYTGAGGLLISFGSAAIYGDKVSATIIDKYDARCGRGAGEPCVKEVYEYRTITNEVHRGEFSVYSGRRTSSIGDEVQIQYSRINPSVSISANVVDSTIQATCLVTVFLVAASAVLIVQWRNRAARGARERQGQHEQN